MSTLFDCGFTPLQAQLDIGLQYYGSKNKITPFLFQNFYKIQPNAKVLFDLFGGGGSVSFAGLASNLKVVYNELKSDMPIMFSYVVDCIKSPRSEIGIFDKDLYRFCDRAQFLEIRDKYKAKVNLSPLDLIRRYIYSFNCAGLTYLKSEWKTQFAKAGHNMVIYPHFKGEIDYKSEMRVFLDYMCGELGNDERILEFMLLDFCENPKLRALSIWDRRKLFGKMIISVEALCIAQLLSHFKGFDCKGIANYPQIKICALIDKYKPDLPKKEYEKPRKKGLSECRALQRCQQLERLQQLEQLEQLERLQQLERLERELPNLTITNKSYADFDFMQISKDFGLKPCEMLIYCDIPYKSTCVDGYHNSDKNTNGFDYDAFIEWSQKQVALGFNVFLSEFETPCPATFKEIASVKKGFRLAKGKGQKRNFVLEKLFLARGIK